MLGWSERNFKIYQLQEVAYRKKLARELAVVKEQRDAELAKAMAAMSEELATLQCNLQKTGDVRLTRLQERYQLETDELKTALEIWKQACQEAKVCGYFFRFSAELNFH